MLLILGLKLVYPKKGSYHPQMAVTDFKDLYVNIMSYFDSTSLSVLEKVEKCPQADYIQSFAISSIRVDFQQRMTSNIRVWHEETLKF